MAKVMPKRFSNTGHYKCANSGKTVKGTVKYTPPHQRTLIYLSFTHTTHTYTCFTKEKQFFENWPKFPIVTYL